jgi:hypothetical protein
MISAVFSNNIEMENVELADPECDNNACGTAYMDLTSALQDQLDDIAFDDRLEIEADDLQIIKVRSLIQVWNKLLSCCPIHMEFHSNRTLFSKCFFESEVNESLSLDCRLVGRALLE